MGDEYDELLKPSQQVPVPINGYSLSKFTNTLKFFVSTLNQHEESIEDGNLHLSLPNLLFELHRLSHRK